MYAIWLVLYFGHVQMPVWVEETVLDFVPWFSVVALMAYGKRYLNFTNRFLKYFSEASYPVYIFHQTVIIVIGFYVIQWDVSLAVKFTVVLVLSFLSTMALYEVVKRANVTRFLFGMKPLPKKAQPMPAPDAEKVVAQPSVRI